MTTRNGTVFFRENLPFPRIQEMSLNELQLLETLESNSHAAKKILARPGASENLIALIEEKAICLESLEHSLSAHWLSRRPKGWAAGKPNTELERLIFLKHNKTICETLNVGSDKEFFSVLKEVCGMAVGLPCVEFRTTPVCLDADIDGTSVQFPDSRMINHYLAELFEAARKSKFSRMATAIFCLVCFLNIHPFRDGNGRCARLLFNAILTSDSVQDPAYFPLNEFIKRTKGGFEIRLRSAELFRDWRPILEHFVLMSEIIITNERKILNN